MPIYEVKRKETNIEYLYVQADSPEEAEVTAKQCDEWRSGQWYEVQLLPTVLANLEYVDGLYVKTQEGYFIYKKQI